MSVLAGSEAQVFQTAARAFCALIEQRAVLTTEQLLARAPAHIVALYGAVTRLPLVEPDSEVTPEQDMNQAEWWVVFRELGRLLGERAFYSEIFDPADGEKSERVTGNLADDLADMYRDLRNGLALEAATGHARPHDVLWTWRFDFESHWGRHATSALRTIHSLLYDHDVLDSDANSDVQAI